MPINLISSNQLCSTSYVNKFRCTHKAEPGWSPSAAGLSLAGSPLTFILAKRVIVVAELRKPLTQARTGLNQFS